MSIQYISDPNGYTTAVVIPIDDWNALRNRHPDIENIENDLPQWQKDIVDRRLQFMKDNPDSFISLEDFKREINEGLDDEF